MARLFTDGAEYGDILFWDTQNNMAVTNAQARSGIYSYFLGGIFTYAGSKNFTATDEVYVRRGLYATYAGKIQALRNGVTDIGYLTLNAMGLIEIYDGAGLLLDTGTIPVFLNTWYLLEWHLKVVNGAGGISAIRIDGVDDAAFSGDTQPGALATVDNFYWSAGGGYASQYIDDIALNDTTGGVDDSWCGDGHVELLVPSGNSPDGGWTDDWMGSDGNQVDNYALVDEVPPNSADYVQDSTPGNQDRYALTDFTGTGKQILRVWVEARALDTVPEGAQMKLGLRLSAADYMSAAISLISNYTRIIGTVYKQNPATGPANWVDADLDAAQVILETV